MNRDTASPPVGQRGCHQRVVAILEGMSVGGFEIAALRRLSSFGVTLLTSVTALACGAPQASAPPPAPWYPPWAFAGWVPPSPPSVAPPAVGTAPADLPGELASVPSPAGPPRDRPWARESLRQVDRPGVQLGSCELGPTQRVQRAGTEVLGGELSPDAVSTRRFAIVRDFRRCLGDERRRGVCYSEGKATVAFGIDEAGVVADVGYRIPADAPDSLAQCLEAAIRSVRFDDPPPSTYVVVRLELALALTQGEVLEQEP